MLNNYLISEKVGKIINTNSTYHMYFKRQDQNDFNILYQFSLN